MNLQLPRWAVGALLMLAALTMTFVTTDAEARRFGGGFSMGRQSSNIMKQRQAVKPPVANAKPAAASTAKGATAGATGAAAAKSGMSRWLGPIAGIAAGLGIAALLSSLGLSGAFLEFLSSAILIGLVIFAIMFIIRKLRGSSGLATAGAYGQGRSGNTQNRSNNTYRQANTFDNQNTAASGSNGSANYATGAASAPVIESVASQESHDPSWFIPADFDVPVFLDQAKTQFKHIQSLWDTGDRDALKALLTDDLMREIEPKLPSPDEANVTDILLLNAELMGIEQVAGGYLASVRYSGMIREQQNQQADHFEEFWNLYKADGQGWLLAGIQQK